MRAQLPPRPGANACKRFAHALGLLLVQTGSCGLFAGAMKQASRGVGGMLVRGAWGAIATGVLRRSADGSGGIRGACHRAACYSALSRRARDTGPMLSVWLCA